jgi:hypothetical protein
MYRTWLYNNIKKKKRKEVIKYGKKWNSRMVIYQQRRDEVMKRIEQQTGAKPGESGMFKHYQAAIKDVIDEMPEEELERARQTAEEWSNSCPPPEVQAKTADKKGAAFIEHFAQEMWRQCGMRVFVLSAWQSSEEEVLSGW